MLVYEETANDLHGELSRIEKKRHLIIFAYYVCSRCSHQAYLESSFRTAQA